MNGSETEVNATLHLAVGPRDIDQGSRAYTWAPVHTRCRKAPDGQRGHERVRLPCYRFRVVRGEMHMWCTDGLKRWRLMSSLGSLRAAPRMKMSGRVVYQEVTPGKPVGNGEVGLGGQEAMSG